MLEIESISLFKIDHVVLIVLFILINRIHAYLIFLLRIQLLLLLKNILFSQYHKVVASIAVDK